MQLGMDLDNFKPDEEVAKLKTLSAWILKSGLAQPHQEHSQFETFIEIIRDNAPRVAVAQLQVGVLAWTF